MSNKRLSKSTIKQVGKYPDVALGIRPWAIASGGTEVTSGGYKYHTFTTSGTLTVTQPGRVEYLVIAGGGGAGSTTDCGGGAGGLLSGEVFLDSNTTVTVGAGGSGGFNSNGAGNEQGHTGFFSRLGDIYAYGGGAGGGTTAGASGGGANGVAIPGLGNNGGTTAGGGYTSAGSGSTGGAGTDAFSTWGNATSTGQNIGGVRWYCGGGAGTGGTGGNGGGGASNTSGAANTGGGGGGDNGSGGSGVVIVRYPV